MRSMRPVLLIVAGLGLASCAGMTPTQQSTGIGALGGAALGGIAGSFSGNAGLGALIGSGVGGAGVYLYGQSQQSQQSRQPSYSGRNSRYRDNGGY
jgi:hypothetical protein